MDVVRLPPFAVKLVNPSNGSREVDKWTRLSGGIISYIIYLGRIHAYVDCGIDSLMAYWDKALTDVKWEVNLEGGQSCFVRYLFLLQIYTAPQAAR